MRSSSPGPGADVRAWIVADDNLGRPILLGLLGAAGGWAYFSARPVHVLVGTTELDALAPALYQACAFLAFVPFAFASALDLGRDRSRALRRMSLVLVTGVLALVRLAGAIPTSGHGIFLGAAIAYEAFERRDRERDGRIVLACAALAITGAYKVLAWHDGAWLALSIVLGGAIGLTIGGAGRVGRSDRRPMREGVRVQTRADYPEDP